VRFRPLPLLGGGSHSDLDTSRRIVLCSIRVLQTQRRAGAGEGFFAMFSFKRADSKSHEQRIKEQINQYAKVENMHSQLADAFRYWQQRYFKPRFQELTGCSNYLDFYAKAFIERINRTGNGNIVSFGSGDGAVEIQIAQVMKKLGATKFRFDLVELSPIQHERARKKAAEAGLADHFQMIEADFNTWKASDVYSCAMAHHALHHVLDLEQLFQSIHDGLHEDGVFVTFDVIGRNGHMRWPEAYKLINLMWHFLPPEKRKHTILKRVDADFYNHDCSTEGFEGIRAQDILPNLIKTFHFETFYGFGNLIDVFTSRGYGPNFDTRKPEDAAFIDFVEELNEILLEVGYLKPTRMCAIMGKKPVANPVLYRGRTPQAMMRDPEGPPFEMPST
jgi:SAM-dependent methyltransferase